MFKILGKPFQGFHWKLTISYTLVTVAALLVVQILAVILVWAVITNSNIYSKALILLIKEELAPQIAVFLEKPEPDVKGLAGWLQAAETSAGLTFQSLNFPVAEVSLSDFDESINLLVLDHELNLLAGIPTVIREDYQSILDQAEQVITIAKSGEEDPSKISRIIPNESLIIAVPVENEYQELLGMIILRTAYPPRGILLGMASYIGGSLIFFTIAAGFVGTLFGFITARGLTRRIRRVSQATDQWSRGDFSSFIQERSKDELGQLARRLNRMAEQLQNLLQTRQEMATLEERNRLARDLHDGVKQQVFATAMQLGAAREMIDQDANAARKHLDQAEQLTRQAQKELTAILRELYPTTLESKGLVPALQELAEEWSRLNKISVEMKLSDQGRLPKEIEQTLFRITQEALSNIAKHSEASQVIIKLSYSRSDVAIMISDDGIGFDHHLVEGKGIGLRNMQERIESLGGGFHLKSTPGGGTELRAECLINKGESL